MVFDWQLEYTSKSGNEHFAYKPKFFAPESEYDFLCLDLCQESIEKEIIRRMEREAGGAQGRKPAILLPFKPDQVKTSKYLSKKGNNIEQIAVEGASAPSKRIVVRYYFPFKGQPGYAKIGPFGKHKIYFRFPNPFHSVYMLIDKHFNSLGKQSKKYSYKAVQFRRFASIEELPSPDSASDVISFLNEWVPTEDASLCEGPPYISGDMGEGDIRVFAVKARPKNSERIPDSIVPTKDTVLPSIMRGSRGKL